ncbi:MAG: metallophosphoesterase [Pseudomonadota bacterium]
MVKLAHLSDPHLPMTKAKLPQLLCKRILGFQSWHFNRKHVHDPAVLAGLVRDMEAFEPDHITVTGDLTNIALPDEFSAAAKWLSSLGPADRVAVIPGNHDAYVKVPHAEGPGRWQQNMQGEYAVPDGLTKNGFPYVRVRKNVALIALSSSVPSAWFAAGGRVDKEQLSALKALLPRLRQQGFFRTVLIHHPPLPGQAKWRKALWNADDLRDILRAEGAELILHGHNHQHMHEKLKTAHGTTHVFGVPSASARETKHKPAAAWNLYHIRRDDGAWRCDVQIRGMGSNAEQFADLRHVAVTFD